jgi:O-antigen/teichoic acid export membrane protein
VEIREALRLGGFSQPVLCLPLTLIPLKLPVENMKLPDTISTSFRTILSKRNLSLTRIRKNFLIGFTGSIIVTLIGLGRTALITKNLPLADYGRILVVLNLFTFVSLFFGLRVNDFIYRFYPKFSSNKDEGGMRAVLILSLLVSMLVGLCIFLGISALSPIIADRFYHDPVYTDLFRIYAFSALFSAFDGYAGAILRLNDRFDKVVIPEIIGSVSSITLIGVYILLSQQDLTIYYVILFLTIGRLLCYGSLLTSAYSYTRPVFFPGAGSGFLDSFMRHKRAFLSTLFHTNMTGYLKMGSQTGGMFLLGILSTPAQVAIYGIAQQLSNMLGLLQNSVYSAIAPEIVRLFGEKKYLQVYRMVNEYTKMAIVFGGLITITVALLAKPLVLIFATSEYLKGLPVLFVFLFTIYLTFISLPYLPVALSLDVLKRRNLFVSMCLGYLMIAVWVGLNALSLAIVQLAGALTIRLFNDLPLLRKVRKLAKDGA